MPRFVQFIFQVWIQAPEPLVQAQFSDLNHQIEARVHPQAPIRIVSQSFKRARYLKARRVGRWWIRQEEWAREHEPDGTVLDTQLKGRRRGTFVAYRFTSSSVGGEPGTMVDVEARIPTSPWAGAWSKAWVRWRALQWLELEVLQNKRDIELYGYQPAPQREAA
jgi:hypothetical protein